MRTLLSICLLFSITIATGSCLTCHSCKNFGGDACKDSTTEKCKPSVTSCITTLTFGKFGGNSYPMVTKSCATNPGLCPATYNMSSGIDLYYVQKCCQEDLCNKGPIELPPINSKENGGQCPACYANAKKCTPTKTIKCRGPQTKCFTFSGRVYDFLTAQIEDWAHRGCITENACQHRSPTFRATYLQEGYKLTCSDSKP